MSSPWALFGEMLLRAHLYEASAGILLHDFLGRYPCGHRQRDGGKVGNQAVRPRASKTVGCSSFCIL